MRVDDGLLRLQLHGELLRRERGLRGLRGLRLLDGRRHRLACLVELEQAAKRRAVRLEEARNGDKLTAARRRLHRCTDPVELSTTLRHTRRTRTSV